MRPKSWGNSPKSDEEDVFELLKQNKHNEAPILDFAETEATASISRLPAKSLPLRSTTHVVRILFWSGALASALIIGLSILTSHISHFLPDTDVLPLTSSISCDLSTNQDGALQNAFTLNLRGATHLSFTEAKAIDVIWQLFVGAGGRFWLAWISYKVFMDGLTRLVEHSPISYKLYASLTFSTTTLQSTYQALKGVFFTKGWRGKLFLLWFGFSTIYVLGFPTLMSATAGYVSPSTAGYNMSDGVFLTPDSDVLTTCFVVNYGVLIGQQNGTIANGPPVSQYNAVPVFNDSSGPPLDSGQSIDTLHVPNFEESYPLFYGLLNSTYHYSPEIYDATNSTSPYSNSTQSSTTPYNQLNLNFTTNITIMGHVYRLHNFDFSPYDAFSANYCYNNKTIPDLKSLAECLPEKYFVWGLSSLMLYINLGLLIIWISGMYLVWLDANIYSALCRSGRKVRGPFRATADLAEAMREVLGDECCAYTDSQLARELSVQPGVKYYSGDSQDGDVSHIGLSSRRLGSVPYNSTKLYGKREKEH